MYTKQIACSKVWAWPVSDRKVQMNCTAILWRNFCYWILSGKMMRLHTEGLGDTAIPQLKLRKNCLKAQYLKPQCSPHLVFQLKLENSLVRKHLVVWLLQNDTLFLRWHSHDNNPLLLWFHPASRALIYSRHLLERGCLFGIGSYFCLANSQMWKNYIF